MSFFGTLDSSSLQGNAALHHLLIKRFRGVSKISVLGLRLSPLNQSAWSIRNVSSRSKESIGMPITRIPVGSISPAGGRGRMRFSRMSSKPGYMAITPITRFSDPGSLPG